MKTLRLTVAAAMFLLSGYVLQDIAFAGTTGKVRGTVKDSKTGEVLPGANVLIRGTTMGAATDEKGQFTILFVPPGRYSIEARMIGYTPMVRQNVNVDVDRTVTVDFGLQQTAIEMQEVVVEAKRDLVQIDVSGTENYISKEEYNATPFANRVEDIIGLQSGVTGNLVEGEIKIREGEAREIGLLVDGFAATDTKFNRPIFSINPGVVQEIKIMRNGFNAEYGESRSGVINIVTRAPSDDFHATLDYQLTPDLRRYVGPDLFDPARRWEYRLYDGPNAMEGGSLTLVEGRHEIIREWRGWNARAEELNNDANPDNDLTPEQARELWRWRHRPYNFGSETGHNIDFSLSGPAKILPGRSNFLLGLKYENRPFSNPQPRNSFDERTVTLKLTSQLTDDSRLTFFGHYSNLATVPQGFSSSQWSNEDLISYSGGSSEIFYPYRKPIIDRLSTLLGLRLLHTFSPSFFLEVNASYFDVRWDMRPGQQASPQDGLVLAGRTYLDPQSGWIPKEQGVEDLATGARLFGGANTVDDSWSKRLTLSSTVTNQFHRNHELKAGFEITFNNINEDRYHEHNDDPAQAFIWKYHVKPYDFSAFIQDKIEFKGMIANVGVRWDYYDTNSDRPDVLRTLEEASDASFYQAVKNDTFPKVRVPAKQYISPRLGVSFPLTASSKIYFNYGHFVTIPPNEALYASTLDAGRPRVQWMGNPHLDYEKTIAYELGYDQNFNDRFQLHIGAFYKDNHDILNGLVWAHSNQSLIAEWPGQRFYQEIRGIEIEVRKAYGRFLTGFFNFNITKKSQADLQVPRFDSCCPIITDDPNVGINGELSGVPRPDISSLAPYGRGVVTVTFPKDWGPRIRNYAFLGNTQTSLRVFYDGPQRIEHPDEQFRIDNPDVEFKTIPYWRTDLRLTRRFDIRDMDLEVYLDVSNLWVSKFRTANTTGGDHTARVDYFNDLYAHGKLDRVGSEEVSDPTLLRTEAFAKYRGELRQYIVGVRYSF